MNAPNQDGASAVNVGVDIPSQADVLAWVRERWPDFCSPLGRAAKVCEEAGEVMGAVIKWQHDGTARKSKHDLGIETAQLVLCAMALAESAGFDLNEYVALEWATIQKRVWWSAADHEPDNPQGVWCCDDHRRQYQKVRADD